MKILGVTPTTIPTPQVPASIAKGLKAKTLKKDCLSLHLSCLFASCETLIFFCLRLLICEREVMVILPTLKGCFRTKVVSKQNLCKLNSAAISSWRIWGQKLHHLPRSQNYEMAELGFESRSVWFWPQYAFNLYALVDGSSNGGH